MVGTDFAVAVKHNVLIARETAAAVIQEHSILAVADDSDFWHVGDSVIVACIAFGLHFRILIAFILRHLQVNVRLHLCLFFQ